MIDQKQGRFVRKATESNGCCYRPDCFEQCLSFHDGLHELKMFLEKKFYTLFNKDIHWIYFHDPNIILGLPIFVGNLFSDLDIFWEKITLEFGNLTRICLD